MVVAIQCSRTGCPHDCCLLSVGSLTVTEKVPSFAAAFLRERTSKHGCWLAWALRSHCWVAAAVEEGIEQTMATCVDTSQVAVNQRAQSFHIADSLCIVVLHGHQWQWCSRTLSCVCSLWSDPVLECTPLSWTCMPPPFGFVRRCQRIHERRLTPSCSLVACIGMLVAWGMFFCFRLRDGSAMAK